MSLNPTEADFPCEHWVETLLARMTLREKIGQLLHPTLTYWDRRIPQSRLTGQVIEFQTGAAFMAGRSFRELRGLARQVLEASKVPVLFSGDCECGAVTAKEGKSFGAAMALAAVENLETASALAYEIGQVTAVQSIACGIRWSLAPVVDINLNPDNPIVNIRSYGDEVERIQACAMGYLRGMEEGGIAATLKHFPGDGMDGRDQHVATTVNSMEFSRWEETYGRLYREGIGAGVSSIMVGHIALSSRSTRSRRGGYLPATADRAIQEDLLRGHLGFKGVILSDAIGMGGIAGHFKSEAAQVVANLEAGSDMVLMPMDVEAAMLAVLKALDEGVLDWKKLEESVRRILRMKYRKIVGGGRPLVPPDEEAERVFEEPGPQTVLAERLALKSVTSVKDIDRLFPLNLSPGSCVMVFDLPEDSSDLAALAVADGGAAADSSGKTAMHLELESQGFQVSWVRHLSEYEQQIEACSLLIYLFRTRPQAGRNSIRVCYNALQSLDFNRIYSAFPCVFVSWGSPTILWDLPQLPNLICTYSGSDEAQRAIVCALFGKIPFQGKCPVRIPEHA